MPHHLSAQTQSCNHCFGFPYRCQRALHHSHARGVVIVAVGSNSRRPGSARWIFAQPFFEDQQAQTKLTVTYPPSYLVCITGPTKRGDKRYFYQIFPVGLFSQPQPLTPFHTIDNQRDQPRKGEQNIPKEWSGGKACELLFPTSNNRTV